MAKKFYTRRKQEKSGKSARLAVGMCLGLAGAASLGYFFSDRLLDEGNDLTAIHAAVNPEGGIELAPETQVWGSGAGGRPTSTTSEALPETYEDEVRVKKQSTFSQTLKEAGLAGADIYQIVEAARAYFDLSRVHSGTRISLKRVIADESVTDLTIHLSKTRSMLISQGPDKAWQVEMHEKPVVTKELVFVGTVRSNLWASAVEAGLDAPAIYAMADIFGWQIDFEREVMPGDSWRLLVERLYVDDHPYGWGNIVMAEYQRGTDNYVAVRYPSEGEEGEYYNLQGDSLRGKFLKSPLRFSRISSRFQIKRFHPILGINRPHYGVDYAAATGTPVRSVGDGTIVLLGRRGGSGKMIKVRHNSSYETAYKHLNAYAKGMRNGSKVSQGQVIGYVGSTGLATGPHLHFEFYENGRYTDPLGKKFPREESIAASAQEGFRNVAQVARQKMHKGLAEKYQIADKR